MRHVAVLLVLAAVAQGQESLEVTAGLKGMVDSYLTAIAKKQWEKRAAEVARLRTPAQVKARQAYIHRKIMEEIGGFPERTPLHARITGTVERDGYRVERLIFESQPRYYVTAAVFVPTAVKGPFPAVLGVAGHAANGKANGLYQRGWIGLAKRGFLVLAYDPQGQGERQQYWDAETKKFRFGGGGTAEHTAAGTQCLLTGTNVARWESFDGVRAFDYLLTRKDVDPKRIAVAGNSGGGTQSAYLAAMEPRLAAAAPSCYITSWEKLWSGPGPQDAEQCFAGFLRDGLDFPDFLIAMAPRPIMMLTAMKDFFPIDGARATYAEARRVFGLLGAADRAGFFTWDDPHGWSQPRREATYRWFTKHLQGKDDDGQEPAFETLQDADLNATETGHVATSLGGETVQSLNAALAQRLYAKRTALSTKNLRPVIAARLAAEGPRGVPAWQKRGEVARQGYRIEKLEMQTEPGITVPTLVFAPDGGPAMKSAVLYLNSEGKAANLSAVEAMVRAGNVVVAPDLRFWGESAPPPTKRSGYNASYQTAQRAFLVGKTLAGMQVYDALRVFDYMATRHGIDARRITVTGAGKGATIAVFTAALEPRIAAVKNETTPMSYMDMVRAKVYEGGMDLIVPGVLRDFDLPDLRK